MAEGAYKSQGFSVVGGHSAKAEKMAAILAAAGRPPKPTDAAPDPGRGSEEIATYPTRPSHVGCTDAADPGMQVKTQPFHAAGDTLPSACRAFDAVLASHAGIATSHLVPRSPSDTDPAPRHMLIFSLRGR